jgi:CheY-like chemotaxis protein
MEGDPKGKKNKSYTILLADDDPDDQQLIIEAFSKINARIYLHPVPDGKSALHYLNRQDQEDLPCLIVLDYNMPEKNGAEVLKHLCLEDRYRDIPKAVLSTSNAPHYVEECLRFGANKFLVKPTSFEKLLSTVQELLDLCIELP